MRFESKQILDIMPVGVPVTSKQIQEMGIKLSPQRISALILSDLNLSHVDTERMATNRNKISLFTRRVL